MTTVTTSTYRENRPALEYAVTHVFFPVQLPEVNDYTPPNDHLLARAVCASAHAFSKVIDDTLELQWNPVVKMLDNLQTSVLSEHLDEGCVISQLGAMQTGDIIAFLIRNRNAAAVFRRRESCTLYESLEASPFRVAVKETTGSLVCSYPASAVEVPNAVFDDPDFRTELSNFLTSPDKVDWNPSNPSPLRSQYITALLTGILRTVGSIPGVPRITKRIRDETGWEGYDDQDDKAKNEWRRSSLWLLIRVAIQTSLDRSVSGRAVYKAFVLFFICALAADANEAELSSDLLHLMSAKILRRLCKLGDSVPGWLSDVALTTCARLQDALEVRWAMLQAAKLPPSPWDPSQLDLTRDTQLSLLHSREYLYSALTNQDHNPAHTSFHPKNHIRGTLEDFLSSNGTFFEDAFRANPFLSLFDVEQSVEQEIDDWVTCVIDIFQACTQLEILMDKYLSSAHHIILATDSSADSSWTYNVTLEHHSIMLLTALELWVALDMLVVGEVPILSDYSPEIPAVFLEQLLLRKSMNSQRLSRAYQYLSSRHSRSYQGWSVLSHEFTESSLPVRYYETCPEMQRLKARIDAELDGCCRDTSGLVLSSNPLHAKVLVFELQCPVLIHMWRSATARLLHHFDYHFYGRELRKDRSNYHFVLLSDIPELGPYLAQHLRQGPSVHIQLRFAHLCPHDPQSQHGPLTGFRYALEVKNEDGSPFEWQQVPGLPPPRLFGLACKRYFSSLCDSDQSREKIIATYFLNTTHTSNGILSAQADCSTSLPLREYITFGQLRSGGSLQWINLLRELRSRALNVHHQHFHFLLAHAASQAGQLELDSGGWMWHQELQDPFFCNRLLDELASLFVDLAASSLDGIAMNTISFLTTRVLSSSPCEDVSERAIGLLRSVREKTFAWVKELSYDLFRDPTSLKCRERLRDMAATCRSTCNVDLVTLRRAIHSAEDVEALLACGIFIHATSPTRLGYTDWYSRALFERDRRLAPVLEVGLKDLILADVSDRGIDLAVRDVWPGYRPGSGRWELLRDHGSHQFKCQTAETDNRPSQTVQVDLLDGSLLADGLPLGGLPAEIRKHPMYLQIFEHSESFIVIPSNLPGMDFVTLALLSENYVHFSLRGEDLVIQAQHNGTNRILQLIPREKLQGDVPQVLIEDHIHWLDLSTATIEIRPLKSLWKHSPENWEIECIAGQYCMRKGGTFLTDIRNPTWEMISSRLRCLELPGNLIVTSSSTSDSSPVPQLSVFLPRYNLSFFVNGDGDLESHDFKEMVYDKDQCAGALLGFENQLVLRSKIQIGGLVPKCVLVPHGHFGESGTFHFDESHRPVKYHAYKVDAELGCLTENTSLWSRVYLSDLHARTSIDWRPDPLTGRTGVQEALCLLWSSGSQSISDFDFGIASHDIPSWHPHYPQIDIIANLLKRRKPQSLLWKSPGDSAQIERSARRGAYLSQANVQAIDGLISLRECNDSDYVSSDPELEGVVHATASAVYYRHVGVSIVKTLSSWAEMDLDDAMRLGVKSAQPRHDRTQWNPHISRRAITSKAQEILQESKTMNHRFRPLFILPTLAYRESPHSQTVLLSLRAAFANQSLKEDFTHVPREPQPNSFPCPPASPQHTFERIPWEVTLDQLLYSRSAPNLPVRSSSSQLLSYSGPPSDWHSPPDALALHRLFTPLGTETAPHFHQEYVSRLLISAQHIRKESIQTHEVTGSPLIGALKDHFAQCRDKYKDSLDIIKQCLGPTATKPLEVALYRSGQWPHITADTLLRCLASTSLIKPPRSWKKCFLSLALILLDLQHARRLLQFALDGLEEEFTKELENSGCDEETIEMYPDWLLIQIQGNFRIRSIQAEIAKEIISPQSGKNTVMQVNMGEGKSSVIIPIAAAALADGRQLVRVIVPKALTSQMYDTLLNCLGGLANKKIYHLPFSRPRRGNGWDETKIDQICQQIPQCMNERGILLVQPEHILSLKLASVEKQLSANKLASEGLPKNHKSIYEHTMTSLSLKSLTGDSHVANVCRSFSRSFNNSSRNGADDDDHDGNTPGALGVAPKLLKLQKWLHSHARDILDESDEILHTRFQIIYAMGLREHIDGYPDRWTITLQVLRLIKRHISSLANNFPDGVEYERGPPGSFPHVRILRGSDAGRWLISLVLEDVMAGLLPDFKFQYIDPALHLAIRYFISSEHVDPEAVEKVQEYVQQSQQSGLWGGLLLLRGLFASNILSFVLVERRWRVDYGLCNYNPGRKRNRTTRLAVPYRAKDEPVPHTQFGHPEITILLTCLSYYYTGLDEGEMKSSFEVLLDQDNPALEFASWIEDCGSDSVPDFLRSLSDINLQSPEQWDKYLFPLFSKNQGAVNLYLSRVVFPEELKEYPSKLSGSSWDLAEERERPITGFSGTADGRYLLPMSISHHDLEHQQGTDARVLASLLRPENDFYMLTAKENGERRTTHTFLEMIVTQKPEIRVLLDVGAQVLDLSNEDVATAWLSLTSDAAGAIYFNEADDFNEGDQLMVLTKNGTTLPLMSSPLAQQLDRCVAYLDHVHTRGTDIKFPKGFRAAVTLGTKVTKDHLVQGCMRMRKLGHGHTVMFFAPFDVDQNIRFVASKKEKNIPITTADILHWAVRETWTDIQQRAYHWAQQGMDHKFRYDAWSLFCKKELTPEKLAEAWLQPDSKPLDDLYSPCETQNTSNSLDPDIRQRCEYLGGVKLTHRSVSLDEEQERQVSRQLEREREVALPPKAEPAQHSLHPDVVDFVTTGRLPSSLIGSTFRPVFTALEKSSAATRETHVWSPFILATEDFCRTIKPDSTRGRMDQYLRPVQWVLSGFCGDRDRNRVLVLLSPFEADCLMPTIRVSEHVHLHVYLPRTTEQMRSADDLKFYTIPPLPDNWTPPWDLIDQLNVFAGQLYLRDYKSYLRLSHFLGVPPTHALSNSTDTFTAPRRNLFIPGGLEEIENTFVDSPLPCVMTLLAIRTRGLPFSETHMGRILQGQSLTPKDFETIPTGHNLILDTVGHDMASHREAYPPLSASSDVSMSSATFYLTQSSKRAREEAEGSETTTGPPSKRLRVD